MKKIKTYDVFFDSDTDSDNKGWQQSLDYCKNFIKTFNGTNNSYFKDYKKGTVSIICNEDQKRVFSTTVK